MVGLSDRIAAPSVRDVAVWPQVERVPFSGTGGGTTTWITLQTSVAAARYWRVLRVYFKRASGDAANYVLRIGEDASAADSDIVYASSVVATSTNDSVDPPVYVQSDANGRLYLMPGWDAGTNNACSGWVELEPVLS